MSDTIALRTDYTAETLRRLASPITNAMSARVRITPGRIDPSSTRLKTLLHNPERSHRTSAQG